MKLAHWIIALSMALSAPTLASVKERHVALPDDLGSAVLYSAKGKKPGPAVIVVHEWWGLNDYARDRARQLAQAGYTAIAVDMYGHGKVADHPQDATGFMQAALAEPEKMNARFQAARQVLLAQSNVDAARVYAVGYCFGGAVVLNQARMGTELAGVASFHGSLGTQTPAQPGQVKARILVATGGADPMVPPQQVGDFVTEMSLAGADITLLSFPGVLHSFTNPAATAVGEEHGMPLAYDAHADKTSWQALMDFLR
jgi:dienelactone hydrolase